MNEVRSSSCLPVWTQISLSMSGRTVCSCCSTVLTCHTLLIHGRVGLFLVPVCITSACVAVLASVLHFPSYCAVTFCLGFRWNESPLRSPASDVCDFSDLTIGSYKGFTLMRGATLCAGLEAQ